ncbi:DUF192 domain-containing protein [Scytonema hofmannii]|nr:DUF192 domain-containing protein [Scytonema hofmannii]
MTTATNHSTTKQHNIGKFLLRTLQIVGPIAGFLAATSPLIYIALFHHPQKLPISATLTSNNQTIELEVAKQPHELEKGLRFRKAIPMNRGMLFVPQNPQQINVWMKNMNFPIDIVFIRNGSVKSIIKNVKPCGKEPCPIYSSQTEVDKVIELPASTTNNLNLKSGSKVNIKFVQPQTQ